MALAVPEPFNYVDTTCVNAVYGGYDGLQIIIC